MYKITIDVMLFMNIIYQIVLLKRYTIIISYIVALCEYYTYTYNI